MATLTLNNEQIIELVTQLDHDNEIKLFQLLLSKRQNRWKELSEIGQTGAIKAAALRGKNWLIMTEEEKEDLIDDIVHEDRTSN